MNASTILAQLQDIVRDITGEDDTELAPATAIEDVDGWDSANHVRIILALEEEFAIRFDPAEVGTVETVGDLVDLVAAKA